MVNINATLPTAIATPFHPAAESLHQDNALRPIIPKSEMVAAYAKFKEHDEHAENNRQARDFIQDKNSQQHQKNKKKQDPEKRRNLFFAKRSGLAEAIDAAIIENVIDDFSIVMLSIQMRYKKSVTPFASASIKHAI